MKTNKTILLLSTYPIKRSFHGGQRRTQAIAEAYTRAGYTTIQSAIFNPPSYAHKYERGRLDLPAPKHTTDKIKRQPLLEDIILGESCYEDNDVKTHLLKLINHYKPGYIDLHQPYLYIGLRKLLAELNNLPKIIFSSQNIEYRMKAEIYRNHVNEISETVAKQSVKKIQDVEKLLCQEAALVTAVSESDIIEHKRMGATNILLVPNGINQPHATQSHIQKWQNYFERHGVTKSILFTGSAHPPNWSGFLTMMGGRLGFLPITSKLMVVGDIGSALEYVLHQRDPVYSSSFWLRAHNCKRLSDEDLSALLKLCDTIILPITEGGGSNLKTAEAIFACKKIVASDHAMRGYDEFRSFPNLFIENDPTAFKSRLREVLGSDAPVLTKGQRQQTHDVLWKSRTKPLKQALGDLT